VRLPLLEGREDRQGTMQWDAGAIYGVAMVPKLGPCRLCLVEGERRKSHILPAWAYRRIVANLPSPARPLQVRAEATIETDRQIWEYLLCDACEERLSPWENYASKVLVQEDGPFPWLAGCTPVVSRDDLEALDASGLDTDALCRFGSSVIWRASVSREAVPGLSLGTYDEQFRRYLFTDGAPFPEKAALVAYLQKPPKTNLPPADQIVTLPVQKRNSGYSCHKFALCGVVFYLFVGGQVPDVFSVLCLARTRRVCAIPSDRFMEDLGGLILKSPPKGVFARKQAQEARANAGYAASIARMPWGTTIARSR
jgi:hypothetical protein